MAAKAFGDRGFALREVPDASAVHGAVLHGVRGLVEPMQVPCRFRVGSMQVPCRFRAGSVRSLENSAGILDVDVIAAVNYLKAVDENRLVRMHLRIGENLVERHEKVVHRVAPLATMRENSCSG